MQHETISADDGEQLHIRLSGSGTPILLLHGWTSSHAAWAPLIKPLAGQHRLLRPDARGHGGHPLSATRAPDVRRLARDVINLLDHYEIGRVVAVGHSMGALTLWQCIRDFGCERFSHLAFIDQSPKLLTDDIWSGGIYGDFDSAHAQRLIDEFESEGNFVEAVLRLIALGLNDKARATYLRNTVDFLQFQDVFSGLVKASVFGFLVTLMGCYQGYNSARGAQGVGAATTNAVVSSSILILIFNYIITELFFSK